MARGTSRAQSEAGTIERSQTAAYRIKAATDLLRNATTGGIDRDNADLAEQVLNRPRRGETEYDINLGRSLAKAGKLNLMDATVDGKEIAREERGAFDKTLTSRRGSRDSQSDFNYEANALNRQEGFVFGTDNNGDLFAIPHTWNVNDPQGTVGIFKGDTITYTDSKGADKTINVIGTFDNTKRGLNLAAAAAGEAMGRSMGVKQTAIILGDKNTASDLTNQRGNYAGNSAYIGKIDSNIVTATNNGGRLSGGIGNRSITVKRRDN